ncbi:MAG: MOSC domain-containing protein [Cyclobacteriaceae bacterium]
MPYIHKITIYPIKSLDGVDVKQSTITEAGSLYLDRAFALYNQAGRTVNAKKYPDLQSVRCHYELEQMSVMLQVNGLEQSFHLLEEQEEIAAFFSDYLHEEIHLKENLTTGFPDDDENSGPTTVSTRTYEELQQWFPGLGLDNLRLRFRANIELGDCPVPFWEDRLFAHPGVNRRFRLGEVEMIGRQACARCSVPARNPLTGVADQSFMKEFVDKRQQSLPSFASEAQFDHFYRLCVNTIIPASEAAKVLKVSDQVHP